MVRDPVTLRAQGGGSAPAQLPESSGDVASPCPLAPGACPRGYLRCPSVVRDQVFSREGTELRAGSSNLSPLLTAVCLSILKQDKSLSKALSGSFSLMWCVGVSVWETQKYVLRVYVCTYSVYVFVCIYIMCVWE